MGSRLRAWRQQEGGVATAALMILLMPIMVGIFGYGFDTARAIYSREVLQGRADLAVITATSTGTVSADGIFRIPTTAPATVYSNYKTNTQPFRDNRLLSCAPAAVTNGTLSTKATGCAGRAKIDGNAIGLGGLSRLCNNLSDYTITPYGVSFSVYETVPTTFLRIVRVNSLKLGMVSAQSLFRAYTY